MRLGASPADAGVEVPELVGRLNLLGIGLTAMLTKVVDGEDGGKFRGGLSPTYELVLNEKGPHG